MEIVKGWGWKDVFGGGSILMVAEMSENDVLDTVLMGRKGATRETLSLLQLGGEREQYYKKQWVSDPSIREGGNHIFKREDSLDDLEWKAILSY